MKISFVAVVFVNWARCGEPRDFSSPLAREGGGVVDGELIQQRIGVRASEALDHMQVLVGTSEARFSIEIGGINDQRVAVPAAERIPSQLRTSRGR